MADKLAAHAAIEERLFYPAVESSKTEDLVLESAEEHLSIKRVLADMLSMKGRRRAFDAKLSCSRSRSTITRTIFESS